jgi:hypothetical protein
VEGFQIVSQPLISNICSGHWFSRPHILMANAELTCNRSRRERVNAKRLT